VLENLGRYEEALEVFNKAIEINSNDEHAFSRKGDVLEDLGRYKEALEAFNKAIKINSNDEYAFSRRVMCWKISEI